MNWVAVSDMLPEESELCNFYDDGHLKITSVLCMDEYGKLEIRNRMIQRTSGAPWLDEHAPIPLDVWTWSKGYVIPNDDDVVWWLPIPNKPEVK